MSTRGGVVGRLVPIVLLCWLALPTPAMAVGTGPWAWPLNGPRETSREFTPPATRYGAGHRGADLPSTAGAAVRAAGPGRVSYAGLLAGRGVVVVTHGALRTTYEPVAAAVQVGDVVPLGGLLGALEPGHEGCPVAACLHWGLRRGELYLDPVRLVVAGPVRLLPPGPDSDAPVAGGDGGADGVDGGADADRRHARSARRPGARATPPTTATGGGPPGGLRAASDAPAGDAPEAAVAVAALVTGLALLVRPRPPTPRPPAPGPPPSLPVPPLPVPPLPVPPAPAVRPGSPAVEQVAQPVVHLTAERARRRRAAS